MARLDSVTVDSLHPARLARFWAAVLEGYAVRPYDEAEIARLKALGFTPETDPTVMVDGPGPSLCFQTNTKRAEIRGRLHFDVRSTSRSAEVERLKALGAMVRDEHADYTVMLDPEGNAFCVLD
jgi:Glyoxalase-like domain